MTSPEVNFYKHNTRKLIAECQVYGYKGVIKEFIDLTRVKHHTEYIVNDYRNYTHPPYNTDFRSNITSKGVWLCFSVGWFSYI